MNCKLLCTLLLLCSTVVAGELPDAPHLKMRDHVVVTDDPFLGEANVVHNAASFAPKPPRNFDWRFVAAHSVYLGSIAFDVYATHQGSQMPCGYVEGGGYGAKSTGSLVRNDLIEFAAVTTVDYLFKRSRVPALSYIGASVGTFKHSRGGAQWVNHCF